MKTIIVIALLLVICLTPLAMAGDKEELQLRSALIQSEIARLQIYRELLSYKIKEVQDELQVINQKIKELETKKPVEGVK